MGIVYFIINLVVSFVPSFGFLSRSAQGSAVQHILALGLILDKWRSDNAAECEDWVEESEGLRLLYNAVKNAQ